MTDNFARCLAAVLQSEGGWADNPKDPGGATMKGVTLAAYQDWLGHPASKEALRAISDDDLQAFYRSRYWLAASCDKLPPGVDYMAFDLAVNSGVGRAAKFVQEAAGVPADGHIGPVTLAAVTGIGARTLVFKLSSMREAFYRDLPTFADFGHGWIDRLNRVTAQAKAWAV